MEGTEKKSSILEMCQSYSESSTTKEYGQIMGNEIVQDMLEYPMHQQVQTFFSTVIKCDLVNKNIFNSSNGWILNGRWKPIITMLDEIRRQVMKGMHDSKQFACTWIYDISPRASKKLEKPRLDSYDWLMPFSEDGE